MSTDHEDVYSDLSESQIDELINALPHSYAHLGNTSLHPNRVAWRQIRGGELAGHSFAKARIAALDGDQECRRMMVQMALIYLKNRLSS